MTTIIFDGDTYTACACTAIPTPQEIEFFGEAFFASKPVPGQRIPAILLDGRYISWADPAILNGRDKIDGDNIQDDFNIAEDIVIDHYGLSSSLDLQLDFDPAETARPISANN